MLLRAILHSATCCYRYFTIVILLFCLHNLSYSQLVIDTSNTPKQLVEEILLGDGVTISNIEFKVNGKEYSNPKSVIALFTDVNGTDTANRHIGLESGVVISTGNVTDAVGPNKLSDTQTRLDLFPYSDKDITKIVGGFNTFDVVTLEFDFVPLSDSIAFKYVFASEEYHEFVNNINDAFGLFLSGPNPSGGDYESKNIAILNTTPELPVTINNVNAGYIKYNGNLAIGESPKNQHLFVNNGNGSVIADPVVPNGEFVEFDGFTKVLTAYAYPLIPCSTYHFKITICDVSDNIYDSGVFLEAGSFETKTLEAYVSDTLIDEGCNSSTLTIVRHTNIQEAEIINIDFLGDAVNGTDFTSVDGSPLPSSISFSENQDTAEIIILPVFDGISEGKEVLELNIYNTLACNPETLVKEITIADIDSIIVEIEARSKVCPGDSILIKANHIGGFGSYKYNWSTGDTTKAIYVAPSVDSYYYVTVTDLCGNNDGIDEILIEVADAPSAAFSSSGSCERTPTIFTNSSSGPIIQHYWKFGDGNTSIEVNPEYPYENEGSFKVLLEVITADACTDTISKRVDITPSPTAGFMFNSNCKDSVLFTDTSAFNLGSISSISWNLDDGNTTTLSNFKHFYENTGTYNVSLTVLGNNGCSNIATHAIDKVDKPVAGFKWNTWCENDTIQFEDTTTLVEVVKWTWDFGDGDTDTISNPKYIYPTIGTNNVKLIIETENGCSDTIIESIDIFNSVDADFGFDGANCENAVKFSDSSKIVNDTIKEYIWNFGDEASGNGDTISYVFSSSIAYDVTLKVVSDKGCVDSITKVVDVKKPPFTEFSFSNNCIYDSIIFIDETPIEEANIVSRKWIFGDGEISTNKDINHKYLTEGNYPVSLIVESKIGCIDTLTQDVLVASKPVASFSNSSGSNCSTDKVNFIQSSTNSIGDIASYLWLFGNGDSDTLENAEYLYESGSSYDVSLIVTSEYNCVDTVTKPLIVASTPVAGFIINDVCLGDSSSFIDTSKIDAGSSIAEYKWDLGNGIYSNEKSPKILYPQTDIIKIKLVVVADNSCIDTVEQVHAVRSIPEVDFSFENVCVGDTVLFTDKTNVNGEKISDYYWDFGFGNTSISKSANYLFENENIYSVLHSATTVFGCSDSIIKEVKIHEFPFINKIDTSSISCFGKCDGEISINVFSPFNEINYNWDDANNTKEAIAKDLCPGTYHVTISNNHGCAITDTFKISPKKPFKVIKSSTEPSCQGACNGSMEVAVTGGEAPYIFEWEDFPKIDTNIISSLCSGTYKVKAYTKNKTCVDSTEVIVYPSNYIPELNVFTDNYKIYRGESSVLNASYNDSYSIQWTPNIKIDNTNSKSPVVSPEETTTYTATITDTAGCTNKELITIEIEITECGEPYIFVPNAFSPNNDNSNDVLYVRGSNFIKELNFAVYNKYGEKVFETTDASIGWDGFYKGELQEPGVFVFYLKATCFGDELYEKQGNVTLLR